MEIKRIKKIQDYRIFQDWSMRRDDADFARFNVIYGGNGSGKSTLASLLSELAKGDWTSGVTLEIVQNSNFSEKAQSQTISVSQPLLESRLCVFNSEYVARNIKFEEGTANSLLYLGEESVKNEEERVRLEDLISTAELEGIPNHKSRLKQLEDGQDKIARNGAKQVVEKLQGVDDRYNGRRYNRSHFKQALASDSRDLSNFDVDRELLRIKVPAKGKLPKVSDLFIPLTELVSEIKELLSDGYLRSD